MDPRTRSRTTSFGATTADAEGRSGFVEDGLPAWSLSWRVYPGLGSLSETTVDYVTPRFKSLINGGAIINNPFTTTKITSRSPVGTFWEHFYTSVNNSYCEVHQTEHKRRYENRGHSATQGSLPDLITSIAQTSLRDSVINQAVTQAHANIDTSEILALATVAESRKTVESILAILIRVQAIARDMRKLRFKSLSGQLKPKELADRYMEARYALRPLYYDARGICRALQKNAGFARTTFRGKASDSLSATQVTDWATLQYLVEAKWEQTCVYEVSAYAGVLCDVTFSDLSTFGIDQLLETAWELVPFSFIVDWFCNAGDWIAAHSPNVGVNERASWVTVKTRYYKASRLSATRSTAASNGYTLNSWHIDGDLIRSREELVLERQVSPELSSFFQSKLRLDEFKLLDLGIIIRKLIS